MKKTVLLFLMFAGLVTIANAQKIAYFEMDAILDKMPEVKRINSELEAKTKEWQQKIDAKFKKLDKMYQTYRENFDKYSGQVRKQKQDEIIKFEQEAKMLRDSIFGPDGELAKLQASKFQPIYDKIFSTARQVGIDNGYDYVIENTKDSQWIYLNPDYDITGLIMKELGLKEE